MLDSFEADPCAAWTIGFIVASVGHLATGKDEKLWRGGAGITGLALLWVLWSGFSTGRNLGSLAVAAVGLTGMLLGTSWIVLAVMAWLVRWAVETHQRGLAKKREEERERQQRQQEHALHLAEMSQPLPS